MLCGGNFGMQLQPHVIELQRIFTLWIQYKFQAGANRMFGGGGGNCPPCPDLEPPLLLHCLTTSQSTTLTKLEENSHNNTLIEWSSDEDSDWPNLTFECFRRFTNLIISWTFLNFLVFYNKNQFKLHSRAFVCWKPEKPASFTLASMTASEHIKSDRLFHTNKTRLTCVRLSISGIDSSFSDSCGNS